MSSFLHFSYSSSEIASASSSRSSLAIFSSGFCTTGDGGARCCRDGLPGGAKAALRLGGPAAYGLARACGLSAEPGESGAGPSSSRTPWRAARTVLMRPKMKPPT